MIIKDPYLAGLNKSYLKFLDEHRVSRREVLDFPEVYKVVFNVTIKRHSDTSLLEEDRAKVLEEVNRMIISVLRSRRKKSIKLPISYFKDITDIIFFIISDIEDDLRSYPKIFLLKKAELPYSLIYY